MASLREEAEYQRLALAMALIKVDDVVAWADQTIEALPEPPIQVIDVALAGSRPADEVVNLLALINGEGDLTAVAHRVLGLFQQKFRSGEVSLKLAVDMLWKYREWADIPEDERLQAGNFYDEFSCAKMGYGTEEGIREGILQFTHHFAT